MIDIGENIREIRKLKGMTQAELGKKIGMSYQQIGQYENGKRNPKLQTIKKLAIALEVSMYDILKIGAEYYQPTGVNLDINIIKNALHSHEAIVKTPLDKITVMAFEELIQYKETELTPNQINGMKKRQEKIDLMATEYDNICEKYDKLYGKEQM